MFKIIHHALYGLLGVELSGRGCRVMTWEFEQDSGIRLEIVLTQRTEKHIVSIRATETVRWREDGTEGRNGCWSKEGRDLQDGTVVHRRRDEMGATKEAWREEEIIVMKVAIHLTT